MFIFLAFTSFLGGVYVRTRDRFKLNEYNHGKNFWKSHSKDLDKTICIGYWKHAGKLTH